jgi:ADP-heptose:LPS heptosyltransferase
MARPLKQLERWGKSLVMRTLARILPVRTAAVPDWSARPWRALYLRYDRIGDMILSSGLFRSLRARHPGITLDVLASPANRTVLEANPRIGAVLCLDRKRWATVPATLHAIRRGHYDIVIDPMVEKPSLIATLLMLVSGARYRIGIGGRKNAFVYTLPVRPAGRDVHHTIQEAVLLEPFGIERGATDLRPEIFIGTAERDSAGAVWEPGELRLLVNISTHHESRFWPASRFIDVIGHVRAAAPSSSIVVIGLARDRSLAESIARAGGARAVATPALRDALALVDTADIVFTPDTSISHAASALQTPAVIMIGPGRAAFEPFANDGRILRATTDDFASISSADVVDALDSVLAGSTNPARTGATAPANPLPA